MELNEKMYEFVQRIETLKDSIATEEATKTSMIMPFFQLPVRKSFFSQSNNRSPVIRLL